ncbi:MAG: WG repeat-containing protein, partial [Bacteroidales bacterium]|nr:WG repeat-containing protein [Bacteroidales bacterium]
MKHILSFIIVILFITQINAQQSKYAFVRSDKKWGVINQEGKLVIDSIFDILYTPIVVNAPYYTNSKKIIHHPGDSLFKFRKSGKYGYMNIYNEIQIPNQYKEAFRFKNGYAITYSDIEYGIINKKGEYIFEPIRYEIIDFNENKILYKTWRKYGFMDFSGKIIIPPIYNKANVFVEDVSCVKFKGKYGFINSKGEWV